MIPYITKENKVWIPSRLRQSVNTEAYAKWSSVIAQHLRRGSVLNRHLCSKGTPIVCPQQNFDESLVRKVALNLPSPGSAPERNLPTRGTSQMSVIKRTIPKVMKITLRKFNQLPYRVSKCYKVKHQEHTPRQIRSFTMSSLNINSCVNLADRLPD